MQGEHLYEYAVLRYVPRVEREEFFNIGLVMMCKRLKWLRLELSVDEARFEVYPGEMSRDSLLRQLGSFADIAAGKPAAGPIAAYPVEERFRWLTAEKSACIRASAVHPGLTDNPDETFNRLFSELVL